MSASAGTAPSVEFKVFGSPRLMVGRREALFRRRQPLAILSALALSDRPLSRDELTYLLWPDVSQEVARQRLRRSLSELRQAVGPLAAELLPDAHNLSSAVLRFNHEICRVDAREFVQLSARAGALPDPDGLRAAEQAAEICAAPLLSGLDLEDAPEFENWLRQQRERFNRLRLDVLRRVARGYVFLRNYPRAIAAVEQALTLDAWSEDLHRKAMWLYAAAGRRSDAIRQYAWCAALLERELAIEPDGQTRALYQAILEDRSASAQALAFPPEADARWAAFVSPAAPNRAPAPLRLARVLPADVRDAVSAAIVQVLDGAPLVVCVQGPPGAGKNALVQAALAEAQRARPAADAWVVSARAAGEDIPFGLLRILLQTALRARLERAGDPAPPQAPPTDPWMNEAVRLLPELRAAFADLQPLDPGAPPADAASQTVLRRRLLQALPRAVQALAGGRPVVIVLNDLDAADDASIEAVGWLARALASSSLALALTWRQPPAALENVLADLRARDRLRVWQLPPLSRQAVLELSRQGGLSPAMAEAIWARSAGAPVAALEMARAAVTLAQSGQPAAPASWREAIEINLRALDPLARQVLEAAAVLGGDTAHWLQHVSGRSPDEVERACETLVACDWFALLGDRYVIASPEVREATLAGLSPARRQRLHRQAAALLRQHNADPHHIARHLELAGQSEEAAEMWLQAARRAQAVYATEAALAAIRHGLALTQDKRLQFELLCQQENVLHDSGRREEQAATLVGLAQLVESSPDHAEWQAELHRRRGRYALARNEWAEAVDALQRAAACTLHNDGEMLRLLARALGQSRRWAEAEVAVQRALALAQRQNDAAEQARCWLLQAELEQWRERPNAVETALKQAVEVAGSGSLLLPQLMLALGNLASQRNDFVGALTYGQEAQRMFARRGLPDQEAAAQVLIARMCTRLGRVDEALAAYQAAYADYAAIELRQGMAASRVNASTLLLRMGDLAGGIALAREAHALFQAIQDLRGVCIAASNTGVALLWMGDGAQAQDWLRQAYEYAIALDLPAQKSSAMANLGAAWLHLGRLDEARRLMEEGLALRQAQGQIDISIDRAFLAIACLRLGDLEAAEAHSAQAVADLQRLPQVEHPQQVWFARAQVLRARGDEAGTAAALRTALDLLAQTEATLPMPWREAYRATFAFNAAMLRAHHNNQWPDPPALV